MDDCNDNGNEPGAEYFRFLARFRSEPMGHGNFVGRLFWLRYFLCLGFCERAWMGFPRNLVFANYDYGQYRDVILRAGAIAKVAGRRDAFTTA